MVKVKRCAYGSCRNDTRYPHRWLSPSIFFVPFPKPKRNFEKCKLWIAACGRTDQFTIHSIKPNIFVCSLHFEGGNGPTSEYPNPVVNKEPDNYYHQPLGTVKTTSDRKNTRKFPNKRRNCEKLNNKVTDIDESTSNVLILFDPEKLLLVNSSSSHPNKELEIVNCDKVSCLENDILSSLKHFKDDSQLFETNNEHGNETEVIPETEEWEATSSNSTVSCYSSASSNATLTSKIIATLYVQQSEETDVHEHIGDEVKTLAKANRKFKKRLITESRKTNRSIDWNLIKSSFKTKGIHLKNWVFAETEGKLLFYKINHNTQTIIVSLAISFNGNRDENEIVGKCQPPDIKVNNKVLKNSHSVYKQIPGKLESEDSIRKALVELDSWQVCVGNKDEKVKRSFEEKKTIPTYNYNYSAKNEAIFSVNCEVLTSKPRCNTCMQARHNLLRSSKRKKQDFCAHTTWAHLTHDELVERLKIKSKNETALRATIRKLRTKIQRDNIPIKLSSSSINRGKNKLF